MPVDTPNEDVCVPECEGKDCGVDGCGGDCGACGDGYFCNTGNCVPDCVALCLEQECGKAGPEDLCNCGDCDDADPCTDDDCVEDICVATPSSGATCDDGNPCTGGDVCLEGSCSGEFLPLEQLIGLECTCATDEDCLPLDDGNLCNGTLFCTEDPGEGYLICMIDPETSLTCGDDFDCTVDSCVPETGCLYQEQDGDCDDDNPCTEDVCDAEKGCLFDVVPVEGFQCDDGNPCTEETVCTDGACQGGDLVNCDDENPCTEDLCEDPGGCIHPNQEGACDDGDPCSLSDACLGGVCFPGVAELSCDDGFLCTLNVCTPFVGCEYPSVEDETPCGEGLHCISGACQPFCVSDCFEKDCGDDGCGGICGYCSVGEVCVAGSCGPATEEDLDHDDVCPLDTCEFMDTDTCPTVWNPDNEAAVCQGLFVSYPVSRALTLGQDAPGAGSTWRRTHEPIEVPLHSGFLDATVVGYYPLAGDGVDHSDLDNDMVLNIDVSYSLGPFGGAGGALSLDGQQCAGIPEVPEHALDAGTLMLWFKLDQPHGPGATVRALVDKQGSEGAYALTLILDSDGRITFGVYPSMGIESQTTTWDTGWHHVAAVWGPDGDILMVDGMLEASTTWPSAGLSITGDDFTVGCVDYETPSLGFAGDIADLVFLSRAAKPGELASYISASARWGTNLIPGTQADWDDLRVTEISDLGDGEHHVPFEVVGPRPHSDTACPAMYQATPTADIPEIRHREDLCGVVGYWRFDGDGLSVPPSPSLTANPVGAFSVARGRFGDLPGAISVGIPEDGLATVGGASPLDVGTNDLTVEFWFRAASPASWVVPIIQKKHTIAPVKGFAVVYSHGNGQVSCEFFAWEMGVISSQVRVDDGAWHHVACVLDQGAAPTGVLRIHVDGIETNHAELDSPFGSMDNTESLEFFSATIDGATFDMELDEVLIHDTAKSREYLRRRAAPTVPTVRFLASTSATANGDIYPWNEYTLHRAGGSVNLSRPFVKSKDGDVCWGLLSPCMGYSGWWRFDEGGGALALDSSTNCNDGEVTDGVWGPGRAGSALLFNGVSTHVQVPHHESLSVPQFVMETSIAFDASTDNQYAGVILKGWAKGPASPNDVVNYMLFKRGNEKIRSFYEHANGNDDYKDSIDSVTFGVWQRWLGQWEFAKLEVFLEDASSGYIVSGSGPGVNSRDLWFGVNNDTCVQPGPQAACLTEHLHGAIDSIRILDRILTTDEFLHYPTTWSLGDLVQ